MRISDWSSDVCSSDLPDGLFTLTEVECLGACANAPMVQINDDNYEDLDYDKTVANLDILARGEQPKIGPQLDRQVSCPEGGPATPKDMVRENPSLRGAGCCLRTRDSHLHISPDSTRA